MECVLCCARKMKNTIENTSALHEPDTRAHQQAATRLQTPQVGNLPASWRTPRKVARTRRRILSQKTRGGETSEQVFTRGRRARGAAEEEARTRTRSSPRPAEVRSSAEVRGSPAPGAQSTERDHVTAAFPYVSQIVRTDFMTGGLIRGG